MNGLYESMRNEQQLLEKRLVELLDETEELRKLILKSKNILESIRPSADNYEFVKLTLQEINVAIHKSNMTYLKQPTMTQ